MGVMHYLGIDKSYSNTPDDEDWKDYCKVREVETFQDIIKKVLEWVTQYPDVAASYLRKAEELDREE